MTKKTINNNLTFINKSALMSHVEGDEEILKIITLEFIKNYQDMLKDIKIAINNKDAKGLALAGHSFKGAVSNFFASKITEQAFQLEQMGKNEEIENANIILVEMEKNINGLIRELETLCNISK